MWSTEGCTTKVYNGTGDGAYTGCECSHLSEFVSVTVPTESFGSVDFGSVDVTDGYPNPDLTLTLNLTLTLTLTLTLNLTLNLTPTLTLTLTLTR